MKMTTIPNATRSGLLSVRAQADSKPVTLNTVLDAFEQFKAKHEARYDAIEAHLDADAIRASGARLNGIGGNLVPVDSGYSTAFSSYTRNGAMDAEAALKEANATGGRAEIHATMSVGDNSSGGYIAPVEWDRKIQVAQRSLSPMRRLAHVITTGRSAYSTLWSTDNWGSGWVGELAERAPTTTTTLSQLVIPAGEIYANPAVTQRLLDDSAIDIDQWIANCLSDEFSRQEAIAFISGDGANKPMGLLQYVAGGAGATAHPGGVLSVTPSGHASTIPGTDVLIDLKYGLAAPYRQNAAWLMNSQTAAVIAKMKDSDGAYIWRETLLASEPSTLLGRPVEIDENMPNIGAGNLAIAFGDFNRGYLINDRIGVRILRDPYTNKPYVQFYATKRVGGGLLDNKAIRLLKIAAS
jgi:HK97 family phage major capsid protein